jgi:hypothetical protein
LYSLGYAVDQQEDVVAVVAVVGVDAELADHLEAVLAPVLDIGQLKWTPKTGQPDKV